MVEFCKDCDDIVICDFCDYFNFNADEDGRYIGEGYCNFHNVQADPLSGCDKFKCFLIKKEENKMGGGIKKGNAVILNISMKGSGDKWPSGDGNKPTENKRPSGG